MKKSILGIFALEICMSMAGCATLSSAYPPTPFHVQTLVFQGQVAT